MARLIIQTPGLGKQTVELRMCVNHVGRSRHCEIHLPHVSVSTRHAELVLTDDGVHLRDCGSTNGTFMDNLPCKEMWLTPGQQVRFGHINLLVESTAPSRYSIAPNRRHQKPLSSKTVARRTIFAACAATPPWPPRKLRRKRKKDFLRCCRKPLSTPFPTRTAGKIKRARSNAPRSKVHVPSSPKQITADVPASRAWFLNNARYVDSASP